MDKKVKNKRTSEDKDTENETEAKKAKVFCGKSFRKELNRETLIPSLKNFLNLAQQNDGDIVSEYLEAGGSVQEMLLLLDQTAKSDLTSALPVFRVLHLIFISIKDNDSKFYTQAKDGAKFMMDSFISTLEAMLNINSNKHRKTALKVLTSVVTLFPCYARDIITLIPSSPSLINQFLRPQSGTDSLRKWSIFFVLSFIIGGDFTLIRTILSIKGLLGDIINDLKFDEAHTVNVFLSVMKEKVLENIKITKTLKLKVFNTQVITSLFEVYNWKGPKNIGVGSSSGKKGLKEKEINPEEKEVVIESIHNFLLVLCTSKKFGIVFSDNTFGTSGEPKNNLLHTVLQSIPEPWENKKMSELVITMVITCPDLMNAVLQKMESAIQPRSSKKWNTLLQFVERLLEAISPRDILNTALEVSEIDLVQLSKQFCTPALLIHNMSLGVRNKNSLPVFYYSMRVLTLMWRNTEEVLISFATHEKLKKTLTSSFNNCFLETDDVLAMWKNICSSSASFDFTDKRNFLNVILDYLEMNSKQRDKDAIDSPTRIASRMLDALDPIQESLDEIDFKIIQSRIFYLLTSVDPMSVTPDSDLFKKAMALLLSNKSKSAIESVTKIVLSTGVFENSESEIDIWLACYFSRFEEYRDYVPGIFTECICQLYLKDVNFRQNFTKNFSKKKSIFIELMELDSCSLFDKKWVNTLTETPTPMLMKAMELLRNSFGSRSKKEKKELQNYISHVAFRLFRYYNDTKSLMKLCLEYKNEISDLVFEYIEEKRGNESFIDDIVFMAPEEREVMTWILNKGKHFKIDETFKGECTSNLKLFLTFNTILSYLLRQVREDCLSDKDVSKLTQCFSFFLNLGTKKKIALDKYSGVLSYDIDNLDFLRAKCLQCLFSLPLVNKFDVCDYENRTVMNFTKLMASVITAMDAEDLKDFPAIYPWKEMFLKKIRSNLADNNKTLEIFDGIDPILDHFNYSSDEISSILDDYCNITDKRDFVSEGQPTMSTMILTKFVKLQCDHSEIDHKIVKKLWDIIQYMNEVNSDNFEIIDKCFVYMLRKRPKSLSLIDEDFFDWFLRRSDCSEERVSLGILLLNDPDKVRQFVTFATDNFKQLKNKKVILIMLSNLVRKEDRFAELLRDHKFCCYWKENELVAEELHNLVKLIYKKYKRCILNCNYKDMDFIIQYSNFFSLLMKCFLDEEDISVMKENISKGVFLPELVHESVLKHHSAEDLVETYVGGLLNIFYQKAKDLENEKCDDLVWAKFSRYICDVFSIEGNFNWSTIANSTVWKDFLRLSLRFCFNFPTCPSLLRTVRCLFELLYKPGESVRDIGVIFEMLISHSQFMGAMLHQSPLKEELANFYYSIIVRNSEVLSLKHIPLILASYSASLSKQDVTLLNILRFYEENNIVMTEYEPLVWGEPAVSHYSVKSNVGVSLWRRVNMLNILELLDAKMIQVSLKEFPFSRTLKGSGVVTFNDKVYDPAFLLPIFANLLSPGAITYCLSFVQKGCFAYTICALSSICREIRIMASAVLARFYNHLELVQSMKLKSVWLHFINCLRYSIDDIVAKPLPSVVTYFLAKTSLELSGEPGEMFTSLQKFLLAKPVFNFRCIPEFLPLFHSSDVQYLKQRRWLLEVLRDGLKQDVDVDLLFQTMAVKIILSYFRSQFCNRETKILVLEVMTNVLKTDKATLLISEYGFLTWLNAICLNCDQEIFSPFVKLLSSTMTVIEAKLMKNVSGKRNLLYPIQILNILMKILPNLKHCRSTETFKTFLSVVLNCLKIMLEFKYVFWCKSNRENLVELSKITVRMAGDESLHEKLAESKFFFAFCDVPSDLERLHRKIMFLGNVLLGF